MLGADYLETLPEGLLELYEQYTQSIINDIARRLAKTGRITASASWQMQRLTESGEVYKNALKQIAKLSGKTVPELRRMFKEAGVKTLKFDDAIYRAAGLKPLPLNLSPAMLEVLGAGLVKTQGVMANLTRTTALSAQQSYIRAADLAYMQITGGAMSYDQAIRAAVKQVASDGLSMIAYPSGHRDQVDVALRRAILTGVQQTAGTLQQARADEMKQDLVQVSAHSGARNEGSGPMNHAEWQGKVYSRSGTSTEHGNFVELTGYGTGPGLLGWNCRHSFYPFFEGISENAYKQHEVDALNKRTVKYQGKDVDQYAASQIQRKMERDIRKLKREAGALGAAGLDNTAELRQVKSIQAELRAFVSETKLPRQSVREGGRVMAVYLPPPTPPRPVTIPPPPGPAGPSPYALNHIGSIPELAIDRSGLPLAYSVNWVDLRANSYRDMLRTRAAEQGIGAEAIMTRDQLTRLNNIAERAGLEQPTITYFGIDRPDFANLAPGERFKALGTRSTTTDLERARAYGKGGGVFEVELGHGTKAVWSYDQIAPELKEIMLLPNAEFEVTGTRNGITQLRLVNDGSRYVRDLHAFGNELDQLAGAKLRAEKRAADAAAEAQRIAKKVDEANAKVAARAQEDRLRAERLARIDAQVEADRIARNADVVEKMRIEREAAAANPGLVKVPQAEADAILQRKRIADQAEADRIEREAELPNRERERDFAKERAAEQKARDAEWAKYGQGPEPLPAGPAPRIPDETGRTPAEIKRNPLRTSSDGVRLYKIEQDYSAGAFDSQKVMVEGKGKAILKGDFSFYEDGNPRPWGTFRITQGFARREVGVYNISELLELKIVPETTIFMEGNKYKSLQTWIENTEIGAKIHPEKIIKDQADQGKIVLLDMLTGNQDRHGKNWLLGAGNKLHGIDNGLGLCSTYEDISDIFDDWRSQTGPLNLAVSNPAMINDRFYLPKKFKKILMKLIASGELEGLILDTVTSAIAANDIKLTNAAMKRADKIVADWDALFWE